LANGFPLRILAAPSVLACLLLIAPSAAAAVVNGQDYYWIDSNFNVILGPSAFLLTNSQAGGGTNGQSNTGLGWQALNANTTGQSNTAMGYAALIVDTTGAYNTALGANTLALNTTGKNNVAIGYNVASTTLTTGTNNILIGTSSAVTTVGAGTNYNLNIGNLLQGDMTNSTALGTEALYLQSASGGVNYFQIAGASSGGGPTLSAQGSDSNVSININPKGSGNIVIGASTGNSALDLSASTNSLLLPNGTTGQRPTPSPGMIRYNSTVPQVEAYYNSAWNALGGGGSSAFSGLTAATAINSIDNLGYAQTWQWNSLAGVTALTLSTTSTSAGSNAQKMLNISLSGTNATSAQTTYGAVISNTHGGTTSTNVGLYATASGGTTANYAALFPAGNVGVGTTAPAATLDVAGTIYSRRVAITYDATTSVDWSQSNIQSITLTGNWAPTAFSNPVDGARYILIIKQDGTGSRTVTWPATVRWPGGTAPTLTTTASKTDYIGFIYNGVDSKYDGVAITQNF
jgi:trimeric autotransporter adhesin